MRPSALHFETCLYKLDLKLAADSSLLLIVIKSMHTAAHVAIDQREIFPKAFKALKVKV